MSIYKPKRSPYWHYDIQWHGRRVFGSTGTAKREDALAIAAAKRRALVLGEFYPDRKRMTLDVALGRYWTEIAQSQSSADTVWGYMERLNAGLGKATMLDEIDGDRLAEHVAIARGARRGRTERIGNNGRLWAIESRTIP